MKQINLWRYNETTGLWRLQRTCVADTAKQWLKIFQEDEPDAIFRLSFNKPKAPPHETAQQP